MREWLKRVWGEAGHKIVANWLLWIFVGVPPVLITLWSYLEDMSGPWIATTGIAALAVTMLVAACCMHTYDWAISRANRKRLSGLTAGEKRVLRQFIDSDSKTRTFNRKDEAVASLEKSQIIEAVKDMPVYPESTKEYDQHARYFIIEAWAWQCLKENPSLLS